MSTKECTGCVLCHSPSEMLDSLDYSVFTLLRLEVIKWNGSGKYILITYGNETCKHHPKTTFLLTKNY